MAQTTTTDTPTIGALIRAWRLFRGLNETQLAVRAGVRKGYVSDIENEKRTHPLLGYLEKLAAALEISLQDIYDRRLPPGHDPQAMSPPLPSTAPVQQPPVPPLLTQEELKRELQQVHQRLDRIEATLKELNHALRENFRSPPPQPFSGDIVQLLARAEASGQVIVLDEQVGSGAAASYHRVWEKAVQWYEEITRVEEQEDPVFLVMEGFPGIIVPPELYDQLVSPIREGDGDEAKFMKQVRELRERRWVAFQKRFVEEKKPFRHIMPFHALVRYQNWGRPSPHGWSCLCGAEWAAAREQRARHIDVLIHLLETCPNYELGLLTGAAGESPIYNRYIWEVKGGHTLLLEKHVPAERGYIVQDPSVVAEVCSHFKWLWESEGMITHPKKVIELLKTDVEAFDKPSATS
jgi:transcriptional regulator with XRE-family HTH domain